MRPDNIPLPEPYLAALVVGAILQRRRPWRMPARPIRRVSGWSLIAGGSGVVIAAWLVTGRTDLDRPDRLMTCGPYARSRNPMYLGWTMLHLGAGLVSGSGWLVAGVPLAVVLTHRQILNEEQVLATRFGEWFECYRREVPRYLRLTVRGSQLLDRRGAGNVAHTAVELQSAGSG